MNADCQPVITRITTNRRRCNTHIVAGDCRQCPDHHNYWCGHRDTNIRGDICAQFAEESPSRQQGHRRRSDRPAQRCLQGELALWDPPLRKSPPPTISQNPHSPTIFEQLMYVLFSRWTLSSQGGNLEKPRWQHTDIKTKSSEDLVEDERDPDVIPSQYGKIINSP